jgi:tRNA(adenine34) deaminase
MHTEHERYMQHALELARQALADGEFPVGCVLVSRGEVVASGKRIGTRKEVPSELDHAEIVALRNWEASGKPGNGNAITLYCTMEPCLMCFGALMISGIHRIVYAYEDAMGGGCGCDMDALPSLYRDTSGRIISGVCRDESMALFKRFFSDPDMDYWSGSHLARYTLAQ